MSNEKEVLIAVNVPLGVDPEKLNVDCYVNGYKSLDFRILPASPAAVGDALETLRQRVAELEKDAARWRLLRDQCQKWRSGLTICRVTEWELIPWSGDDPDAAMDALLSASAQAKE